MREIKFRAWDKANKIMVEAMVLDFVVGMIHTDTYDDRHGEPICGGVIQNFEIMQCTGLKDKNEKEIYEGDVMRSSFPSRDNIPTMIQVVRWKDKDAGFMAADHPLEFRIGGRLHPIWWPTNCQVIGNIYENPELLDKED